MGGLIDGWMECGSKSHFKECLQQTKIVQCITSIAEAHGESCNSTYCNPRLGNNDKRRHERQKSSKEQNHAQLATTRSKFVKEKL